MQKANPYTVVMTASLVALAAAVVTVVAYALLADRLDYATVHRRQLDVWAAMAGFVCLTAMLYGAADVRREARMQRMSPDAAATPSEVVERHEPVPLRVDDSGGGVVEKSDESVVIVAVVPGTDDDQVQPRSSGVVETLLLRRGGDREVDAAEEFESPAVAVPTQDLPLAQEVLTPSLGAPMFSTPPLPTQAPVVVVATESAQPPPQPTSPPATQAPPTASPQPLPTATPHCGDPADIDVTLQVVYARFDRQAEPPRVGYEARVTNHSTFPVRLVDILVSVESRSVGAEQFGHSTLRDVDVEAGVVYSLAGEVELTKSPPPFGTSQVCVSFVTETCGRSLPYQITKHCKAAGGL